MPDEEIEKHIDGCEQCQDLVEGFLAGEQKITLPDAKVTEDNLKKRVEHYDKGRIRIAVFTIVGLIMGFFSMRYTEIDFLPLKLVLAIPYKISEMVHITLHHHQAAGLSMGMSNEFFPQSIWATFIGEKIVASLAGGAIYGAMAYLTGDKKVFTLSRFIKFCGIWIVIFCATVYASFVVADVAHHKNMTFENIYGFAIEYESGGSGVYQGSKDFEKLQEALFSEGKLKLSAKERNPEDEERFEMFYQNNTGCIAFSIFH